MGGGACDGIGTIRDGRVLSEARKEELGRSTKAAVFGTRITTAVGSCDHYYRSISQSFAARLGGGLYSTFTRCDMSELIDGERKQTPLHSLAIAGSLSWGWMNWVDGRGG